MTDNFTKTFKSRFILYENKYKSFIRKYINTFNLLRCFYSIKTILWALYEVIRVV